MSEPYGQYPHEPYGQPGKPYGQQDGEPYGQPGQPYRQYPQAPHAYGQPYPMAQPEHPQGTTILVLGILGFFVIGICAPFAWYLGSKALKEGRAAGVVYSNQQSIVVGRVLGMIMTILAVVAIIFFVVLLIVLFAASGTR